MKEKGHHATHCTDKESKGGSKTKKGIDKNEKGKQFNGNCNHCGKGNTLVFNIVVQTDTRLVYCLYINRLSNELACSSIACRKPCSFNDEHERLGHPGKDTTHYIIKGLNINIKPGTMDVLGLHHGQDKQKIIVQFSLHKKSQVSGKRDFIELSCV